MPSESRQYDAGVFEAVKIPESSEQSAADKAPGKPKPNYEKLNQLKAEAAARIAQKESALKASEAPKIDSIRQMAQDLAAALSGGKPFAELSGAEKSELAKGMMSANAERLEGNQAVARGENIRKPIEQPRIDQNAGMYDAITPDQIAAAERGALAPDGSIMKEVSPLSSIGDTQRLDRVPDAKPPQKKNFFQSLFG